MRINSSTIKSPSSYHIFQTLDEIAWNTYKEPPQIVFPCTKYSSKNGWNCIPEHFQYYSEQCDKGRPRWRCKTLLVVAIARLPRWVMTRQAISALVSKRALNFIITCGQNRVKRPGPRTMCHFRRGWSALLDRGVSSFENWSRVLSSYASMVYNMISPILLSHPERHEGVKRMMVTGINFPCCMEKFAHTTFVEPTIYNKPTMTRFPMDGQQRLGILKKPILKDFS